LPRRSIFLLLPRQNVRSQAHRFAPPARGVNHIAGKVGQPLRMIRQKGHQMNQTMFALSLGLGGMIAASDIAFGNTQCDTRDRVVAMLADKYGETRRGLGIAGQNAVMEIFAATDTGTWTITVTLPDGRMCLMASGAGYETLTEELPAKGSKV
jgi:hypothetical protein